MSKLLRFLVNHRLSDSSQPLKGYTIAVDALGRADGFDAHIDSYPRVQMGRLRRILDHFYLRNGGENRLVIPYNHYEILLEPNNSGDAADMTDFIDEAEMASSKRRSAMNIKIRNSTWSFTPVQFLMILSAAIFLTVAAGLFVLRSERADRIAYPAIIVMKPVGMANESSTDRAHAIQMYLVSALNKFDHLRVYNEQAGEAGGSEYLLESSILEETGSRIQLRLVDGATGEVIWSNRVAITDPESLESDLAKDVIAVASPYGVISRSELARYRGDHAVGYPCLLHFHQYLRYREQNALKPVLECIDKSAKRFRDDAYMVSMLAVAKDISARVGAPYRIDGSSKEMAERAVKLNSGSASATFAVAQSAFIEGDCLKGVSWGKRAVELNPLNSRIAGYLGLNMLACQLPEGEEYAAKALDMDPNTDLVVAAMLAFQKLKRGDAQGAQAFSLKYMAAAEKVEPGLELTYILSTATLGDKREARRAWRRLTARYGLPETVTPRQVMSRWIASPAVLREVELAFDKVQLY